MQAKIPEATAEERTTIFTELKKSLVEVVITVSGATIIATLYYFLSEDQKKFIVRSLLLKFNTLIDHDSCVQLLICLVKVGSLIEWGLQLAKDITMHVVPKKHFFIIF